MFPPLSLSLSSQAYSIADPVDGGGARGVVVRMCEAEADPM